MGYSIMDDGDWDDFWAELGIDPDHRLENSQELDPFSLHACFAAIDNETSSIYQPLAETEIRLLTVWPGSFGDAVRCSLAATKATQGYEEYDAISYTWAGDDDIIEKTGRVCIASEEFPVTPNCEAVLRRVRREWTPRIVWIDAICVNQDDVHERGRQVRLMPQIYSRAREVIIYVGESNNEIPRLFSYLRQPQHGSPPDSRQEAQSALAKLLTRRYFSRAWVIQEVALARRATLVCGSHTLSWPLIHVKNLAARGLLPSTPGENGGLPGLQPLPPVIQFKTPTFRTTGDILRLLDSARSSRAADPRDKVFAVLGLITCPESEGFSADYTKTPAEVFTSTALWIAQRFGMLALLARTVDVVRSVPASEAVVLESAWVPNWTEDTFQSPDSSLLRIRRDYRAVPKAAGLPITVSERDPSEIRFPAFRLGRIVDEVMAYDEESSQWFLQNVTGRARSVHVPPPPWVFTIFGDYVNGRRAAETYSFIFLREDRDFPSLATEAFSKCYAGFPITFKTLEAYTEWNKSSIYLLPEPDDYGNFQFTDLGTVSVFADGKSLTWLHRSLNGRTTRGKFSKYAVCCAVDELGGPGRLRGLLYMDGTSYSGVWKTGEFAFVCAK
ncbi:heterokaryon incompatibility protein [Colletotrichum karsti]|uniref:Heterokaryon incompatibility protein n=1 Tax=Colletotrichum karsti TaxID=1095194 RepID=A0A9P6IHC4_9PEZI|nr:heterokaryon incompatibility protein [Colletotrichum karsti]KAF9882251.1 heterokaryon incompatibility protein [Colletotrichum karsti]